MHAWLMSISEHPHLVLAVVFATACVESVAVVGTLVPAGIIMFVAGALIGAGALNGWFTLGVAALGAVIGDGLSYELGRRFHGEVRSWWQARGHEAVWGRGEQFVQQHGGKSIVLARFFAPVRAVVPLVVGAARMRRLSFYPVNIASALAWAPAHIAPGIVFGASAALAEAVSARLAVMLIVLAVLLWLVVRVVRLVIRFGLPVARRIAQFAMLRLARRFPKFGRHVLLTVGAADPEFTTLAALALLLTGSVWLFAGVLQDVIANDPLLQADTALFTFLQSLHTAPVDAAMMAVTVLNSHAVGLTVAAAVLIWLVLQRSWRTAAWWIVVVGVAAVLTPVVGLTSNGTLPSGWQPGSPHTPLPDGRAAFSLLTYAFLGWLLARRSGHGGRAMDRAGRIRRPLPGQSLAFRTPRWLESRARVACGARRHIHLVACARRCAAQGAGAAGRRDARSRRSVDHSPAPATSQRGGHGRPTRCFVDLRAMARHRLAATAGTPDRNRWRRGRAAPSAVAGKR